MTTRVSLVTTARVSLVTTERSVVSLGNQCLHLLQLLCRCVLTSPGCELHMDAVMVCGLAPGSGLNIVVLTAICVLTGLSTLFFFYSMFQFVLSSLGGHGDSFYLGAIMVNCFEPSCACLCSLHLGFSGVLLGAGVGGGVYVTSSHELPHNFLE